MMDNYDYYIMYMAWELPTEYWDGPEDEEGDDEWVDAYDEFLKDNDLPMTIGVKVPYGQFDRMDDLKHELSEHYGHMAKSYDYTVFDSEEKWLRRLETVESPDRYSQAILEWTPEGFEDYDARLVKESGNGIKKLLKMNGVTKFPSGMVFSDTEAKWSKHRGHAGSNTIRNMCIQLEHAGWKRGDWRTGGIPDGSAVANSNDYISPDGQITMSYTEYYGSTAYDNSLYITFKLVGEDVNESIVSEGEVSYKTMEKYGRQLKYALDKFEEIINQPHIDDYVMRHKGRMIIAWDTLLPNDPDPYHGNDEMYDAICQYLSDDTVVVRPGTNEWLVTFPDMMNESSRFGFNVGDQVELKVGKEPNRFGGWGKVEAGAQGEIVAIDKPMPGAIKVKLEDGTVVTMGERQLKFAGTDNEPWEKYKVPAKPKPTLDEILAKHGPEEIYMEPPRHPGSPKWTGD